MDIAQLMSVFQGQLFIFGVFSIGNILLLWMMFRGVTNAYVYGANTFGKVIHSVMSVCVVIFNLGILGQISSTLNNWAYSLSQMEGDLGSAQLFVDRMAATGYAEPSLIPTNPVALIFWIAVLIGLLGGMWTDPGPKEETA